MKAIVQTALGEPTDVLTLIEIEDAIAPAAGEVVIDVSLTPVHHGDLHLIRSQPEISGDQRHVRRGSEAVGIVRALGRDAEQRGELKIGDRVIAFPAIGGWAERVAIPASAAIPIPPELGDEVAGQLLINYVTARMILRRLRQTVAEETLREGAVLVTGASTVVARLLLHFLKEDGLAPIGLARSQASARRVEAELAGIPVAATEDDAWSSRVTSLAAGKTIVAVLDCVSGALVRRLAPLLADDAAIITYGGLDGGTIDIPVLEIVDHQFAICGVTFSRWFSEVPPDEQRADIHAAFRLAADMPFLFKTGGVYGLADYKQAIAAVEAPNRDGFVFLKP